LGLALDLPLICRVHFGRVGTFIAAGLVHGRERAAALTGGCAISLFFVARVAIHLYVWRYMDPTLYLVPEPWYQHGIDGLMIFAPPILVSYVAELAEDVHRETPAGFGGIARAHFIWLWFVAFWYAGGLIAPVARIYMYAAGPDTQLIIAVPILLGNVIPAAALAIPGYFGLALLSGHLGSQLGSTLRNVCGIVVLIVGWIAGAMMQIGWIGCAKRSSTPFLANAASIIARIYENLLCLRSHWRIPCPDHFCFGAFVVTWLCQREGKSKRTLELQDSAHAGNSHHPLRPLPDRVFAHWRRPHGAV
jgi:hypothetical protein